MDAVELQGAASLDADALLDGLVTRPPRGLMFVERSEYDPLAVALDRRRIESYYRSRGFFDARVSDVEVTTLPQAGREGRPAPVRVVFVVQEGPRTRLARVDVTGVPPELGLGEAEVLGLTGLTVGAPVDYGAYLAAQERLVERLRGLGHARAAVSGTLEVDRESQRATARYVVTAGPLARFGAISVEGDGLPEAAIRARVAFAPGDRYDPERLSITEGRLYELASVGAVRIEEKKGAPEAASADRVDIVVKLTRATRNELALGAGAAFVGAQQQATEVRGRASYTRRGFLDPLATLRLELRPAYRILPSNSGLEVEARAQLTQDDFLSPRLRLDQQLTYALTRVPAYTALGPAARLALGRPWLRDRLILSLGGSLASYAFTSIEPAIPRDQFETLGLPPCDATCAADEAYSPLNLAYLEPSITYDGRDDPLRTRSGFWVRVTAQLGTSFGGLSSPFFRVVPEVRGYLRLFTPRLGLGARVLVGLSGLGPLPMTQRFFEGGADSHRGFVRQRLSPGYRNADDSFIPVGGESAYEASVELRATLFQLFGDDVGAALFLDAGDVADGGPSSLDLARPYLAAGPGLRYLTPVGAVRVDLGVRLNRLEPGRDGFSDRVVLHFSLGEAF